MTLRLLTLRATGKFLPTLTHYFYFLLQKHGLLQRIFTQNIDTCVEPRPVLNFHRSRMLTTFAMYQRLERVAGVRESLIVEAHGSFASARCIVCHKEAAQAWLKEKVEAGERDYSSILQNLKSLYVDEKVASFPLKGAVPLCPAPSCKDEARAYVKPDIVFFGESLPDIFFTHLGDLASCDLLLVFGTSLKVHVRQTCLRLLTGAQRKLIIT